MRIEWPPVSGSKRLASICGVTRFGRNRLSLSGMGGRFLCVVLVWVAGCGRSSSAPEGASATTAASQPRSSCRRIISLSPNVTEILFALDQGHRVVGVSSYCTYPPEVTRLPRCGGIMDTDLERILTLRPDLIIIHGQNAAAEQFSLQNSISLLKVVPNDMDGLYRAIRVIADTLDCRPRAEQVVRDIQLAIDRVAEAVRGKPPVSVFLAIDRSPDQIKSPSTTNGAGFVSKMLEVAGGRNIFAGTDAPYPVVVVGEIVRRQPEVIIELMPGRRLTESQRRTMIDQWAALGSIPAVANHRIYFVTEDYAMILGPRVAAVAQRFAEILHADSGQPRHP